MGPDPGASGAGVGTDQEDVMMRIRWIAGLAVVFAAVACATTGAVLFGEEKDGDGAEAAELRTVLFSAVEILSEGTVPPGKAVEAALAKEPGTAVDVELAVFRKDEAKHLVWEVEILGGKDVRKVSVDVKTGDVVDDRPDEDRGEHAELTKRLAGRDVDLGRAVASTDAGLVVEAELGSEDGDLIFEVKVVHDGRIVERDLDAKSGRVRPDDDEGGD